VTASRGTTIPQNEVGEGTRGAQEPRAGTTGIKDANFIKELNRLRELRSFLLQEGVPVSPGDSAALSLGDLNLLQCDDSGRVPTKEEWSELENRSQALFRLLSDPLRRRFLLGEIPTWFSTLSISLVFAALVALGVAMLALYVPLPRNMNTGSLVFIFYLIWLVSLGAIGSVAFIGMNALSVQQDVTFDLSNRIFILLRIALGALFGLVLALPFAFRAFYGFLHGIQMFNPENPGQTPDWQTVSAQAMLLLLPFIVGFSTSLVVVIMNRLVDGVQAFFGRNGSRDGQASPTPAPPPSASTRAQKPLVAAVHVPEDQLTD
jgi:hypothetical protein